MNVPSLRRPSPVEAYNDRQKGRRIEESPFSASTANSVHATAPSFFGNLLRSCGGPSSSHKAQGVGSSAPSGCLGISIGGDGGPIGTTHDKTAPEDDDPAALIAKAMSHLSLMERAQAYEDLHGVSAAVHESPELISESLDEMEHYLQNNHHKPAYDMAITISADFVQAPNLRLMFLRADRFEATLAAERFVKFLDWKLLLFGQEKLCQWHIGLNDLDQYARFLVESGSSQFLPGRDSRGRPVFVVSEYYFIRWHKSTKSTLQMLYYLYQCVAEDETNQKHGLVAIAYCLGQQGEEQAMQSEKLINTIWQSTKLLTSMPVRTEASHFCMAKNNSIGVRFTLPLVTSGFGLFNRARLRVHFGSPMECEYALMSFGLPSALLPFTPDGELKMGNHKKWVKRRNVKEQELLLHGSTFFSGIDLPHRNDILLGKGRPCQNHPGNQRFLELCGFYLEEYNQSSRMGGRTNVARKFIQEILHPTRNSNSRVDLLHPRADGGGGARFLQRRDDKLNSGWWEEVTDEDVLIDKVTNTLRGLRKQASSRSGDGCKR
jgi:hypothetical protein